MKKVPIGVANVNLIVDIVTQLCLNRGISIEGLIFEQTITKTIKNIEEDKGIMIVGKRGE